MSTTLEKVDGHRALAIKHQLRSKRHYFDVSVDSICLSAADTGRAYCLVEASLAPGMGVPRHTHTREDETYYVTSGELEMRSLRSRQTNNLMAAATVPKLVTMA
jgi:quercetin dioxygenase-like cupin family protein